MTIEELNAANNALKDWFISQDVKPHESTQVMCLFLAAMIITNSKTEEDIPRKLEKLNEAILSFIALLQISKAIS